MWDDAWIGGIPKFPTSVVHICTTLRVRTLAGQGDPATGRAFEWEFRRGSEVFPIRQSARLMVSDVETMIGACCEGAGIAQVMEFGSQHMMASARRDLS